VTATPPPGWYPDPEAAGRQWRWWDGARWAPPAYGWARAFDPLAHAHAVEQTAQTARNTGRWLKWAFVANAIGYVGALAGTAGFLLDIHHQLGETDPNAGSFRALGWSFLLAPLQLFVYAAIALLIAWIYHAGKFAEYQGWPAARSRGLGAFSVIIPIVSLWWPYEAVRDLYPPGRAPRLVLQWWLSYLLVPLVATFAVAIPALAGWTAASIVTVIGAAALLVVPAVFGWRLVDDVEAMQRAQLAS
jgi:hypothetical protein